MKLFFVKLLGIALLMLLLSCYRPHMNDCFLRSYPVVVITGFDTLEVDSIKINKYIAKFGFDSLVSSKMVSVHDDFVYLSNDSFYLTPYLQDHPMNDYVGTLYNFVVSFGNMREVKLSEIKHKDDKCESNQSDIKQGCYCSYLGCNIATIACQHTVARQGIFVHP